MSYLIGFLILMVGVSAGVFIYAAAQHGLRHEDDSEVTAVFYYYSMTTVVVFGSLLVGLLMYRLFS